MNTDNSNEITKICLEKQTIGPEFHLFSLKAKRIPKMVSLEIFNKKAWRTYLAF